MDSSNLQFMTCDELRAEIAKCPDEINKRILIIDVRNKALYDRSHLCLDSRNNIHSIKTKMRVMNIDPDLVTGCTSYKIMSILDKSHHKVFENRRDATDVIIIDSNTDNISQLLDPRSKVMRVINALTKFDNQPDKKIIVPIHILKGGFREWLIKYPHFTTDSTFNPDSLVSDFDTQPVSTQPSITNSHPSNPAIEKDENDKEQLLNPSFPLPSLAPQLQPSRPISKPLPAIPSGVVAPLTPKLNNVKNAPGTAVPVTPILSLNTVLSRSHSSPDVAQADGDVMNEPRDQLERLTLANNIASHTGFTSNHVNPSAPYPKPRFDRTLKPAFNNDALKAIRAQINFGRSPEAIGKQITGLQNLGNTCFMNSVIQCLAYTPRLTSDICSNKYYNAINLNSQYGSKGELAVEFGALVEKLNAHTHRYIEPKSFRESIIRHIGFAGNEQQDSHEFMMMLFDKLHHDLNTSDKSKHKQNGTISTANDEDIQFTHWWSRQKYLNTSIISDVFEGAFMSTVTCTLCGKKSETFDVFNCLSLPIPSETRCHLRDCLSHFSKPERIEAAWDCPRCKQKREAVKELVICKLPEVLIIHLKRFSQDVRFRQKLPTTVDFPLNDLRVDCKTPPQTPPNNYSYNLFAVVNHYGHLDGGHYTAFCKLENQRWYTFDDSNVSEMKDTDVCGQAAYILFYSANC